MSTLKNKLADRIKQNPEYEDTTNKLFGSYINSITGIEDDLERSEIKKLISAAQVFYSSDDTKLRNEGSVVLSMLLDLYAKKYNDIIPIAFNIYLNSGDFPNISLLSTRYPEIDYRFSIFDETQTEIRESLNTVEELDFPLTDFQRSLWHDLISNEDVITAAPTSAGKTHIILSYLMHKVTSSDGAFAAVVVPTRALISEVASKVYELAKKFNAEESIEICTVPKESEFSNKTFFIMTQERLHEILQNGDITFDYLFIDEAHNISDKSRGVLLHITIEKMLEDSYPQLVISMPSTSYQNAFYSIFKDVDFKKKLTEESPVSKMIMTVEPKGTRLIISRKNSNNSIRIKKGFTKKKLADIVVKLGANESNIIYRNKTDDCENVAGEISKIINETEINPQLEEAADYIEKFVHQDFSLAKNLRKGVAFHYGPLPSSVRVMIENLAKDNQIKYIVCTSTLAEGVNLPAKNLFLKNPSQPIIYQPSERLEDVKLKNITGRAGRMLEHFSGNIYIVEPETWSFKDYFDDKPEDKKIPTYFKSLNEELEDILKGLNGSFNHEEGDQYRIYTIANKLIKEHASGVLENTLSTEEITLNINQIKTLSDAVSAAYDDLKVTSFTLEANPTIGYIQQNKIFSFLSALDSFNQWVLPHPKSHTLYEVMLPIIKKLSESGLFIPSGEYSIEFICLITTKWIQGISLKEIISDQIDWDIKKSEKLSKRPPSTNSSVRNVIKAINNDIRFRLSNALRCYNTLLTDVIASRDLDITSVKLHSYIEVGACDERMINLINIGLSREAAKDIDDCIAGNISIETMIDLSRLYQTGGINSIHTISKKEIEKLIIL